MVKRAVDATLLVEEIDNLNVEVEHGYTSLELYAQHDLHERKKK